MENLNEIWTHNSAYLIKQSIIKAKEMGVCDDGTIEKVIKEDLCGNFDSVCVQLRKVKKDLSIKEYELRMANESIIRLEKKIKSLEMEDKRR